MYIGVDNMVQPTREHMVNYTGTMTQDICTIIYI